MDGVDEIGEMDRLRDRNCNPCLLLRMPLEKGSCLTTAASQESSAKDRSALGKKGAENNSKATSKSSPFRRLVSSSRHPVSSKGHPSIRRCESPEAVEQNDGEEESISDQYGKWVKTADGFGRFTFGGVGQRFAVRGSPSIRIQRTLGGVSKIPLSRLAGIPSLPTPAPTIPPTIAAVVSASPPHWIIVVTACLKFVGCESQA